MAGPLGELVKCWIDWGGIDARLAPDPAALSSGFRGEVESCRPGADPMAIAGWEDRHGYRLPHGLKAWLRLSNGLFGTGPLIHPITAIGPMIPFARVPEMIVQPESWFELGNPNLQTICIDLGYRLPGGSFPIFTSGDDASESPPLLIAQLRGVVSGAIAAGGPRILVRRRLSMPGRSLAVASPPCHAAVSLRTAPGVRRPRRAA